MKKKLFLLLMSLMMVFAFAGCGSSSEEQAEEEHAASEVAEEQEPDGAMSGGWEIDADDAAAKLPEEVQTAFDKATEQLDGNDLTPVAYFSKQIVAGTNYQVLCRSMPVTENPVPKLQVALIYADLEGNAEITNITDFNIAAYTDNAGADLSAEDVTGGL